MVLSGWYFWIWFPPGIACDFLLVCSSWKFETWMTWTGVFRSPRALGTGSTLNHGILRCSVFFGCLGVCMAVSKPWYLVNPKIAGKWMFIPLKCIYRYWSIPIWCVELVFVFGFPNSDLLCEHELHTSLIGWLTGAPCPIRVLIHRYIHCYFSKAIIIEAEIPHTGTLQVRMCWSLAHWLGWHKRTSIEDVSKWWYFMIFLTSPSHVFGDHRVQHVYFSSVLCLISGCSESTQLVIPDSDWITPRDKFWESGFRKHHV